MLHGDEPHAYAVYADDEDTVWVTNFEANAILRFNPDTKSFDSFPSDKPNAARTAGEIWGAESGTNRLVMIRAAE
jgi:virginiamycin B lyase